MTGRSVFCRKLEEAEMKDMVEQQCVFTFPTEEELNDPTSLKDVQQRIRDVIMVLNDFKRYREAGRSRTEYVELLRSDLCSYYSYNSFLMEKLMQIFPFTELVEFLEASEVQRPMTIRTNTLKSRRRDLAQVRSMSISLFMLVLRGSYSNLFYSRH